MTDVLREGAIWGQTHTHTHTHKGKTPYETKAEVAVMLLQAKELKNSPQTTRS